MTLLLSAVGYFFESTNELCLPYVLWHHLGPLGHCRAREDKRCHSLLDGLHLGWGRRGGQGRLNTVTPIFPLQPCVAISLTTCTELQNGTNYMVKMLGALCKFVQSIKLIALCNS